MPALSSTHGRSFFLVQGLGNELQLRYLRSSKQLLARKLPDKKEVARRRKLRSYGIEFIRDPMPPSPLAASRTTVSFTSSSSEEWMLFDCYGK